LKQLQQQNSEIAFAAERNICERSERIEKSQDTISQKRKFNKR
jgi:hypothetical protein